MLRDYLTPENHRELLEAATGKTKLQVQEMLARRFPRPDVASTMWKLPSPRGPAPAPAPAPARMPTLALPSSVPPRAPGASEAQPPRKAVIEPLSSARYRIQLNASAELKQKLDHALDLRSHSNPSGGLSLVIERALDLMIERVEMQRFAQTKSPRRGRDSGSEKRRRRALPRPSRGG